MPLRPPLPLQARHRALAELELLIAKAEETVATLCRAADDGDRSARMRLVIALGRLARLEASRRVLVAGEAGGDEE